VQLSNALWLGVGRPNFKIGLYPALDNEVTRPANFEMGVTGIPQRFHMAFTVYG